jgi:hypothetical protein
MRRVHSSRTDVAAKALNDELAMLKEVLEDEQRENREMMDHITDIEKRSEHRFGKPL